MCHCRTLGFWKFQEVKLSNFKDLNYCRESTLNSEGTSAVEVNFRKENDRIKLFEYYVYYSNHADKLGCQILGY